MSSNAKNIAVVIPKYGLVGGAERFAYELTERLARTDRFNIHVFANRWESHSTRITFHKIPVVRFPRFLAPISFAYVAGLKISHMSFDLIHTHESIFAADLFTVHGIPHRIWIDEVRKKRMSLFDRSLNWVEQRLMNNARCRTILPVSTLTRDKLIQEYNIDKGKMEVIHPGVDVENFQRLDREQCRSEMRSRFDIHHDDIVILFVSMNFEIKGLDRVMAVIAQVKTSCPSKHIKLLIVGKGNYKKYAAFAQKMGIQDDVMFAGVQTHDLKKIYMASDIFMMLSRFDTFGMTVLEAMAASLPVVISSTVGAKDLIVDGGNGFVIEDVHNIDMICDRIRYMLDKDNRLKMAREAHNTALSNSWDNLAKRVQDIYVERLRQQ